MPIHRIILVAGLLALLPIAPQSTPTPDGPELRVSANTAEAGRYGRSSFSSSRSSFSSWGRSSKSYSKPSRSYSKPKTTRKSTTTRRTTTDRKTTTTSRKAATATSRTSGGYQKPGGARITKSATGTTRIQRTSDYATTLKKQRAAAAKTRSAEINKARSSATFQKATRGSRYDAKRVSEARDRYFDRNPSYRTRYQRFDGYGFERRDYGGFDPSFLMVMAMSDDPGSAALWYGMTGSPWLAMWMSDARESAAAQGDQEVLARLDAIERQVENAPAGSPDAASVLAEQGIPASVAFAPDVLTGEPDVTPKIRFGTGGTDGVYYTVCAGDDRGLTGLKARVGDAAEVTCVPTGGSKENVVSVVSGAHQCVIAQSDVIDAQLRANPSLSFGPYQLNAYPEAFWLIVNDDSGIESVSDLDPSQHTLLMGGSGAAAAWANLAYHASGEWFGNDRYARFQPETVDREAGLELVAEQRDTAMLVVMGMNSSFMKTANDRYGDDVRLAAFDDGDFNDLEDREGNRIYSFATVPGGTYPGLQDGWWDSSVETLSVQAVVVCNPNAMQSFGKAGRDVLLTGLNMVLPEVRQRTLGLD